MARLNREGLGWIRPQRLKVISSCICTGIAGRRGFRAARGFFRTSGIAIGKSSCTQAPFSMLCPSTRWFISDGRARPLGEHGRPLLMNITELSAVRKSALGRAAHVVTVYLAQGADYLSEGLERREQHEVLGVYFIGKRVTRTDVEDHCDTHGIVGQGVTSPLAGKPPGWGRAPLKMHSIPACRGLFEYSAFSHHYFLSTCSFISAFSFRFTSRFLPRSLSSAVSVPLLFVVSRLLRKWRENVGYEVKAAPGVDKSGTYGIGEWVRHWGTKVHRSRFSRVVGRGGDRDAAMPGAGDGTPYDTAPVARVIELTS